MPLQIEALDSRDYLGVIDTVSKLVKQGRRPSLFHAEREATVIIPDKPIPDKGVHWQIDFSSGTIIFADSRGNLISTSTAIRLTPEAAQRTQDLLGQHK